MKSFEKIQFNNHEIFIGISSIRGFQKNENQDNVCIFHNDEKICLFCADGLGSAFNSKLGSANINIVASKLLSSDCDLEQFPRLLREEWLKTLDCNPLSCDTTFKFILLTKEKVIYGGIGDGWLVGIVDNQYFSLINKDNFANQTESMMSLGYMDNFIVREFNYKSIEALSLATDGFSEDFEPNKIEDFLKYGRNEMVEDGDKFVNDLEQMIENWPIKSNQDDKSVIILGVNNVK